MTRIGFSTGSLAGSDMRTALSRLDRTNSSAIELSSLRMAELQPMLEMLSTVDLLHFSYVSVHAPSSFTAEEEAGVAEALLPLAERGWPVVLHPDTIHAPECWIPFGRMLCVENMDTRKASGRTVGELALIFRELPEASLCFDLAHARQCDSSMTEAYLILSAYKERLMQVHISDLDVESRHSRLTWGAVRAYLEVADLIPESVPIIIESPVLLEEVDEELMHALEAVGRAPADSI